MRYMISGAILILAGAVLHSAYLVSRTIGKVDSSAMMDVVSFLSGILGFVGLCLLIAGFFAKSEK